MQKIYTRHADEFTDAMTATIRQGRSRVRIFSPRGYHLIGMFARTERAKAFRRWVLDVLEDVEQPSTPAPAKPDPLPLHPEYFRPAILAHLIRRLRDPHPMDTYGQTTLKAETAAELARLIDDSATDGTSQRGRRRRNLAEIQAGIAEISAKVEPPETNSSPKPGPGPEPGPGGEPKCSRPAPESPPAAFASAAALHKQRGARA